MKFTIIKSALVAYMNEHVRPYHANEDYFMGVNGDQKTNDIIFKIIRSQNMTQLCAKIVLITDEYVRERIDDCLKMVFDISEDEIREEMVVVSSLVRLNLFFDAKATYRACLYEICVNKMTESEFLEYEATNREVTNNDIR